MENDLPKFEQAFAKGDIDTVVFVNSPGGDLWTGLRVGRLIADKGYKTVVAGHCYSACSIMFMAGRERRFSGAIRAGLTRIGIHGAHDRISKQVSVQLQQQIYAFYKLHMGDSFNSTIMNQALYDMDDAGAMLTVHDAARSAKVDPLHCRSSQTPRDKCTRFPGETAMTLGITTHADLVALDLPPAFRPSATLVGQPLPAEDDDPAQRLADIAARYCSNDNCRDSMAKYRERAEFRALAVPVIGRGAGWTGNANNLNQALLRAVYACNHAAVQSARLCEAELVNNHPVRHLYRQADAAHEAALARLTIPAERHYANEEFAIGFTQANAYRTDKLVDITPLRIDGVKTVDTQELARMLSAAARPVVVDVAGSFETIPGATGFFGAGAAYDDPVKDEALDKRIGHLISVIAPDKSAPVVFFCAGRNCWTAVNAALRARRLGYTDVLWYRGGLEAWRSAGLPTALGILRAAASNQ